MSRIVDTRCHHHPGREAVARCVSCGRFCCRECITEHHDRMICAGCLRPTAGRRRGSRLISVLLATFRVTGGVLVLWLTFYAAGMALVRVPSEMHPWALVRELVDNSFTKP